MELELPCDSSRSSPDEFDLVPRAEPSVELGPPRIPPALRKYVLPRDVTRPVAKPQPQMRFEFAVDFTGYMDLVLASYMTLEQTPPFADRIPYCLYQYYAVFLLWRRLALLGTRFFGSPRHHSSGLLDYDFPVPAHLYEYLLCLGYVTDPLGVHWMPDVTPEVTWKHLEFPGGLCTPLHFTLFETLPYPIVSLKIKNDILYTLSSEVDTYWTIDPMYITTPGPWKRPNSHILGYHPADILSGHQLDTLLSAGFPLTENGWTARLPRLKQVRVSALRMAADALSQTFPDSTPLSVPNNSHGSLLQLPFCELIQVPKDPEYDLALPARTHSFFVFPLHLLLKANIFRYRLKRATWTHQCGLGYDWDSSFSTLSHFYENAAIREIRLFRCVFPSHINLPRFTLGPLGGLQYLFQYLQTIPSLLTPCYLSAEPADVVPDYIPSTHV